MKPIFQKDIPFVAGLEKITIMNDANQYYFLMRKLLMPMVKSKDNDRKYVASRDDYIKYFNYNY